MNIIVLVKQVPDIAHIPEEAWDREKGTLRRNMLDAVINPLDLQALTFGLGVRKAVDPAGRVVCLSMGPSKAREALAECLARGADEAVLLSDPAFSGADTVATAYALAQAVRRIALEMFRGEPYMIVAGMQSVDGDTAQVPPQVAEELGIDHIAYTQSFRRQEDGALAFVRIGPEGLETLSAGQYPVLVTVTQCGPVASRSFAAARAAGDHGMHVWSAASVGADTDRIGLSGSKTWVSRIFAAGAGRAQPCRFEQDPAALLEQLRRDYGRHTRREEGVAAYDLGSGVSCRQGEVWAVAEMSGGALLPVALELTGQAARLAAQLRQSAGVVVAGDPGEAGLSALFAAGADKVYILGHPLLSGFLPRHHGDALSALVKARAPQIVLFGATPSGRELAPRVAYATGAGLTADCTGLRIDDHIHGAKMHKAVLFQTRPALGGNIMATILTKDGALQMATVRPGVFSAPAGVLSRKGEVIRACPALDEKGSHVKVVAQEALGPQVRLGAADVIVCGGRGLGSRRDFEQLLYPLADALGKWLNTKVEVAASRMAVEDGFLGHERQVGQTGQAVAPKLYVAVGVSGAVQHITGMQASGLVLAINKDPHARIFQYSDLGIVGDLHEELPRLTAALAGRRP